MDLGLEAPLPPSRSPQQTRTPLQGVFPHNAGSPSPVSPAAIVTSGSIVGIVSSHTNYSASHSFYGRKVQKYLPCNECYDGQC